MLSVQSRATGVAPTATPGQSKLLEGAFFWNCFDGQLHSSPRTCFHGRFSGGVCGGFPGFGFGSSGSAFFWGGGGGGGFGFRFVLEFGLGFRGRGGLGSGSRLVFFCWGGGSGSGWSSGLGIGGVVRVRVRFGLGGGIRVRVFFWGVSVLGSRSARVPFGPAASCAQKASPGRARWPVAILRRICCWIDGCILIGWKAHSSWKLTSTVGQRASKISSKKSHPQSFRLKRLGGEPTLPIQV